MPSSMDDTSPTKPETPIFSEPIVRNEFHSALTSDDVTDADTIKVEEDKPHSPFDGGEWMAKLYVSWPGTLQSIHSRFRETPITQFLPHK